MFKYNKKHIQIGNIQIGKFPRDISSSGYLYELEKWSLGFSYNNFIYGIIRFFTKEEVVTLTDAVFKDGDLSEAEEYEALVDKLVTMRVHRVTHHQDRTNPKGIVNEEYNKYLEGLEEDYKCLVSHIQQKD